MDFTPRTPSGKGRARRRETAASWLRQHSQCALVLGICLVATLLMWNRARDAAWTELDRNLNRTADQIRNEIASKFDRQEHVLHVCRALFEASTDVTRSDWRVFVDGINLETSAPGVIGLAFIERVPDDRFDAMEAEMRAGEAPGFTIRDRADADGSAPPGLSYIIKYHEPAEVNRSAWGVDVASIERNRAIYDDAATANAVRVAAGFSLVQMPTPNYGMVMALPVYKRAEEGPPYLMGWTTAAMLLDRFIESVWQENWDGFRIELTMRNHDGNSTIFRTSAADHGCSPALARASDPMMRTIDKFGRSVSLRITPASADHLAPDMHNADLVITIGGLATALLTLVAWSATSTRQRAVAIARDMTDSLRASESLQRELAVRAEQASLAKSEFLANMSHEIRTPMTAILGYTDLIDTGDMDEKTRADSVRAMRRAGRHLLTIINDVLDISKIESGHMRVHREPCRLRPLIDDVLNGLRNQASQSNNALEAEVSDGVPDSVMTDPHRLRQILINLIGNALKFTEDGSVAVRVSHDGARLLVDVADTGVGIAPEKIESIFRPFEQGDTSSTRRHDGTGLGLTISRRLADLLGGDLTANSVLGVGSVFSLSIPAPAAESTGPAQEPSALAPAGGPGSAGEKLCGRVLLVEDGPDNQRLISFILRRAGLCVSLAGNGREALDLIEAGGEFDLIVTDMQMPEMDGYEATRRLRAMGYTLPVLALTANAMEGDRERCLEAGCDEYEPKPIDRASLINTVGRLLDGPSGRSANAAA